MKPQTLHEIIALQIRSNREKRGLSQDELAGFMRTWGFAWKRDTIAAVETGKRQVAIGELLALRHILEAKLETLLDSNGDDIEVAPGTVVTCRSLQSLFTNSPAIEFKSTPFLKRFADLMRSGLELQAPGASLSMFAQEAAGDTEQKIASKLSSVCGRKVYPLDVVILSHRLWGRTLAAERDGRLTAPGRKRKHLARRTEQALRGHITRELFEELRQTIRQMKTRK